MSNDIPVRVITAFDTGNGKARAVYETDDGLIGLAEGRIDRGEAGRTLFPPLRLDDMRRTAERAISGDVRVIAHPKTILVLATALVAVLETVEQPKGD